jgi:hypothetical protein
MVRRGGLRTGLIKRDKKLAPAGEEREMAKNVPRVLAVKSDAKVTTTGQGTVKLMSSIQQSTEHR